MAFNTTHASGVHRSLSSSMGNTGSRSGLHPIHHDGYALGELVRGALDTLVGAWQKVREQELSSNDLGYLFKFKGASELQALFEINP